MGRIITLDRETPFFRPAVDMALSVTACEWALTEYRHNMLREATTLFVSPEDLALAKAVLAHPETHFHLNIHTVSGWSDGWWSIGELLVYGWGSNAS